MPLQIPAVMVSIREGKNENLRVDLSAGYRARNDRYQCASSRVHISRFFRRSPQHGCEWKCGDDYTKYTTSSYHGQTKQDEYIHVDTVYAPVADTLYWTWSTPAPTSVSFYKAGEWTGPAQPVKHAEETMEPIVRPAAPKPPGVSHIEIINGKEVTVLPY